MKNQSLTCIETQVESTERSSQDHNIQQEQLRQGHGRQKDYNISRIKHGKAKNENKTCIRESHKPKRTSHNREPPKKHQSPG